MPGTRDPQPSTGFPNKIVTLAGGWAEEDKYSFDTAVNLIIFQARASVDTQFSYRRDDNRYFTLRAGNAMKLASHNVEGDTVYFRGPAGTVIEILEQIAL